MEVRLLETKKELTKTRGRLSTAIQLLIQGKDSDEEAADFIVACLKRLKSESEPFEIVMPKFSEYCRSGETWYCPPFCLTVKAKTRQQVAISLLLLQGKFDDQLEWPMSCPSWSFQDARCPSLWTAASCTMPPNKN